jgi:hypothetical protein
MSCDTEVEAEQEYFFFAEAHHICMAFLGLRMQKRRQSTWASQNEAAIGIMSK